MSADTNTPATVRTVRKVNFAPLAVSFALNALVQFAIQAWLAYSFAAHVWHLPGPLPYLAPVALDAFVVNLMVVTYELRTARLRTRAYAWGVLALGIGAQIGAAEGYAAHAHWGAWARVASFAPALLLAASLHTMIIRRKQGDPPTDSPARGVDVMIEQHGRKSTPAEQAAGAAPVTQRPPRPAAAPAAPPVSSGRNPRLSRSAAEFEAVQLVRKLVANGTSCAVAATQVGRSKRWAEKHTADVRANLATRGDVQLHEPAIAAGPADLPKDDAPVDLAIDPEFPGDLPGNSD